MQKIWVQYVSSQVDASSQPRKIEILANGYKIFTFQYTLTKIPKEIGKFENAHFE